MQENKVSDFIKNPILIRNSYNYERITEKILKQLILENLDNFLTELGDRYNYIDLILFNIKYNCYVVVELKVTELKKNIYGN